MANKNPFNTGSPVRGDGFIGRQNIISHIISFLKDHTQFNQLIYGQRRIGKTSLLRKLQDDPVLHKLAVPIYYNLQDKSETELHQLLYDIAARVVLDLEFKIELKDKDFSAIHAPLYFQNSFIPLVCGLLPKQKHLLLLFDEFDVLGDIEEIEGDAAIDSIAAKKFIPFMASLIESIQAHACPVKFIFAIGRNYKDLDQKRFGQITKFGPSEEISCFSKEETLTLLNLSHQSISFEPEAVDQIFAFTSGHPYFTQCLASVSTELAEKNNIKRITADIVRAQLKSAIKRFSSGIYWIWDSLSPNHQIILYLIAILREENKPVQLETIREKAATLEVVPALENLEKTLANLKQSKFLKSNDHSNYDFYVEFIRKWVVEEVTGKEIEKLLDQVDEEIIFHLNNARYYFKKKNYKTTIEHSTEVLEKSPFHFEALLLVARSYVNLKNEDAQYLEKAIESYKSAYEINRAKTQKEYLGLLKEKLAELENNVPILNTSEESGRKHEEILKEIQKIEPNNSEIIEKLTSFSILKNKNISFGDDATINGDFVVAEKIHGSFNKIEISSVSNELKTLLKDLSQSVSRMADKMDREKAEEVLKDFKTFIEEAVSQKPRKRWWQLSAEGIKDAALTVGELGLVAIKNLDKVIPMLEKLG